MKFASKKAYISKNKIAKKEEKEEGNTSTLIYTHVSSH